MLILIKMVDVLKIAKMDSKDRESAMQKLFGDIFKESDAKKVEMLKSFIMEMNKADDETYINLCRTNLGIASSMDDNTLKTFIGLRMKANSELPEDIKVRDMNMIKEAMEKSPKSVSAKISKFMGQ
jgi:hypothetical protein